MVQSCFLQIRNIAKKKKPFPIRRILKWSLMPSYHLDLIIGIHCTHYFIHHTTISHLPRIQHSAARLLTVLQLFWQSKNRTISHQILAKSYKLLSKSFMTLHHPTSKIYSQFMSPAHQTTPYYMFLLSPLFKKKKQLRNSLKFYGQLTQWNLLKHFLKPTSLGRPSRSKPEVSLLFFSFFPITP